MSVWTRTGWFVGLLLLAAPAMAAGGHDEGFPLWSLIFSTINLTLFILVLRRFALPPIRAWVRERHDRILRDLNAAADARAAAEQLKADWEERIAGLDDKLAAMRKQAQGDAEIERERILAEAHRTAERVVRDAEQAATAELRELQTQLRAELADRALKLAEETVRRDWTDVDQNRFVDEFVRQVQA